MNRLTAIIALVTMASCIPPETTSPAEQCQTTDPTGPYDTSLVADDLELLDN
jgi:hypothetical protein